MEAAKNVVLHLFSGKDGHRLVVVCHVRDGAGGKQPVRAPRSVLGTEYYRKISQSTDRLFWRQETGQSLCMDFMESKARGSWSGARRTRS